MITYPHLSESAAVKMTLTDDERLFHLKQKDWVPYRKAGDLLDKWTDLIRMPSQPHLPNMLVASEPRNGKTSLIQQFNRLQMPEDEDFGQNKVCPISIPVLYIQAQPNFDERAFCHAILARLFEPHLPKESISLKRNRTISSLRRLDLGMIMIDDIDHFLMSNNEQGANLDVLKYLGTELEIPIVGMGTKKAIRAIQTDVELASHFTFEILPKWSNGEDLTKLLKHFEQIIPLKHPSLLHSPELADFILKKSGGILGEIASLIHAAAIHAIKMKTERITIDVLRRCNYASGFRE